MLTLTKRLLIGRPLATSESEHQRLPKTIALATFSSDPISSTAYAIEEILWVTAIGASSLALGLDHLVPMAIAVAILLVIVVVVTSYRQTIFAYPNGGGAYIVSRENLGEMPSLVAGASLLIDYVLTVAVSISAGVAAILSLDAFAGLRDQRVALTLFFVVLLTAANLRGLKESGRMFAAPTYIYIVSLTALVVIGVWRVFFGHVDPVPFDEHAAEEVNRLVGGELPLFLMLRGFSSGAVALSGVEAISNGIPAFRRPESKNAATTLTTMAFILGTLFLGVSILASHLEPLPSHDETVISQMGRAVFGAGPMHTVLQFATAGILILAANTAYVDFPRLSSIIAKDAYLPRQFANRGDRLVFSNGILFLAAASAALLVGFGGLTNALIPLYAVGVFTSFTLSQAGMVRHHQRLREPGWKRGIVINGVGAVATFIVLVIVAVTKFAVGAWLPIIVVPMIIVLSSAGPPMSSAETMSHAASNASGSTGSSKWRTNSPVVAAMYARYSFSTAFRNAARKIHSRISGSSVSFRRSTRCTRPQASTERASAWSSRSGSRVVLASATATKRVNSSRRPRTLRTSRSSTVWPRPRSAMPSFTGSRWRDSLTSQRAVSCTFSAGLPTARSRSRSGSTTRIASPARAAAYTLRRARCREAQCRCSYGTHPHRRTNAPGSILVELRRARVHTRPIPRS